MNSLAIASALAAAALLALAAYLLVRFARRSSALARERDEARRALEGSRRLFDGADAALIIHSPDGAILDLNGAALELFGIPGREAALSLRVPELSTMASSIAPVLKEYWDRALSGEKPSFEWETRGPAGLPLFVETSVRSVEWEGRPALIATIRDLSLRKQVESERDAIQSQLYQMQKMDALSRLAGGFANDFNNALTGIMGTLSVLRMLNESPEGPDPKEVGHYLRTAIDSCTRAGDLVSQLLTLSRRDGTKLAELDLKETVSHVVQICRNSFPKSISIEYRESSAASLPVLGDQAQLDQAILNVCINAYQAMTVQEGEGGGEGGALAVEVGVSEPDVRQPGLLPDLSIDRHYARVVIRDSGVGISMESQKRLFEPFFSTKSREEGTGLGLSIVYSIMKRHGGSVEISSIEGRGTTVALYLPLLAPRKASAAPEGEAPPEQGDGLVLVVDDENAVRISAEGMLKLCGYRVLAAESGRAGVAAYRERREEIALVLMDVAMPGMSGLEALREIMALDPGAKVVMMSGFVENEGINQALGSGALAFLRKPFTMRYLSKTVKAAIESGAPPA